MKVTIHKIILIFFVSFLVISCHTRQNYQGANDVVDEKLFRTDALPKDSLSMANLSWKEIFTDAVLQKHIAKALENNLEIIPVLNKIDLPHADPEKAAAEIRDIIGLDIENIATVSAKSGIGVLELLDRVIERVPPPAGKITNPTQALIFDSWFDSYRGVVILVRVFVGIIKLKDKIYLKKSDKEYEVLELAVNEPLYSKVDSLGA